MSVHNFDKKLQESIVDFGKHPFASIASVVGFLLMCFWWIIVTIGGILSAVLGAAIFIISFVVGFCSTALGIIFNNIFLSGWFILIGYGVYFFFIK